MNNSRILVVDDEEDLCEILRFNLTCQFSSLFVTALRICAIFYCTTRHWPWAEKRPAAKVKRKIKASCFIIDLKFIIFITNFF